MIIMIKKRKIKISIEIIIAKQRNGPVGTVQLAFVKEFNKFVNLERRFDDGHAPRRIAEVLIK